MNYSGKKASNGRFAWTSQRKALIQPLFHKFLHCRITSSSTNSMFWAGCKKLLLIHRFAATILLSVWKALAS